MLLVEEDHDCEKTRLLTIFQNVLQLTSGHFGVVLPSFRGCFQTVTGARFVVQQNLKRDRLKTIKSLLRSLTAKCAF